MTNPTERAETRLLRLFQRILPASLLAVPLTSVGCSRSPSAKETADASAANAAVVDPCAPKLRGLVITTESDGGGDFRYSETYACGVPPTVHATNAACAFTVSDCQTLCTALGACGCRTADAACPSGSLVDSGPVVIKCDLDCFGNTGRRPRGLVELASAPSGSDLGEFFARTAHLEAASVRAFQDLALGLRRLGAPLDLITEARAAAADEKRHAKATGRLARRFGGRPSDVRMSAASAPISLEDLAVENAVEGCVRETYGALVASFQARRATDAEVSTVMIRIAKDETRHAALAWAIAHWAEPRLGRGARRRVADARRSTALRLERGAAEPSRDLVRWAGLPDRREQVRLLRALGGRLWARGGRGLV